MLKQEQERLKACKEACEERSKAIQDVEVAVHRCEEEQMEKEHEHMELQKRLTTLENVGEEAA